MGILKKYISHVTTDDKKCSLNQILHNIKQQFECKNPIKHLVCKKNYIRNLSVCACEINEYLKSYTYMKRLIDDSVITCDEIINAADTVPIYSIDNKASYKMDYYIFHFFYQ